MVLGDLNARVGNTVIGGVVARYGVPGVNESGECLIEMCIDQELVVGNTFFKKKKKNKYTWARMAGGRVTPPKYRTQFSKLNETPGWS